MLCILSACLAGLFAGSCKVQEPDTPLINGEMDITKNHDESIWRVEVDGRVDRGYFYPDENVVYWTASLPKLTGQAAHYEVRGQFPHARFMSLQGYTQRGASLDGLYDFQILPSDGSENPFLDGAVYPADQEKTAYRVHIISSAAPGGGAAGIPNTLYLESAGDETRCTVVYRVYWNALSPDATIPDGYDHRQWEKQGQKPLPSIYYVVDDLSQPHYMSVDELYGDIKGVLGIRIVADIINAAGRCLAPWIAAIDRGIGRLASDPSDWFIGGDILKGFVPLFEQYPAIKNFLNSRDTVRANVFPNNATAYYATFLNPNYGEINVTRFKAPTFPNVEAGAVIDSAQQQVRYWSVCMHDPFLMYTTACKKDSEFILDADGFVTLVFSDIRTRPLDPDTGKPVQNWLPLPSPNSLVFYRHMLPSPWFTQSAYYYKQSVSDAAQLNDYEAVSEWSGDYCPESVYCSKKQFETDKCQGRPAAASTAAGRISP